MKLNQLEIFYNVALLGNMNKAAETMRVSQPFLSRTIADLEEELGVQLFDRVGRNIHLNAYGEAFLRRVQRVFSELKSAEEEFQDIQKRLEGNITLVSNASIYAAKLIQDLYEHYTNFTVHQVSADRQHIILMLETGLADFGLLAPPLEKKAGSSFESIRLSREDLLFSCSNECRFAKMKQVTPAELSRESLIATAPGYAIRDYADMFFEQIGISPHIAIQSNDTAMVAMYLKAGMVGFSMFSRSIIEDDPYLDRNKFSVAGYHLEGAIDLVFLKE